MGRPKGKFWQKKWGSDALQHTFYKMNAMHKSTLEWSESGVGLVDFFVQLPNTVDITEDEAKLVLKKLFNPLTEGKHLNVILNNQYSSRRGKQTRVIRAQHFFKKSTRPTEEEAYEYEKKIAEFKNECLQYQ